MAYTCTIYLLVGFFVICIRETKQHFFYYFSPEPDPDQYMNSGHRTWYIKCGHSIRCGQLCSSIRNKIIMDYPKNRDPVYTRPDAYCH
jgi:hypothetical protein